MTVSDIDPVLAKSLQRTLQSKSFTDDWTELIPKVQSRIRQIIQLHYRDYQDYTTCEHIININTNVKELKLDELSLDSFMNEIDSIINNRFNKQPPFTILRIAELLLFDQEQSTKIIYDNNPIKFLRLLWYCFNVVTVVNELDQSVEQSPKLNTDDTLTMLMTLIPWLDEVDDDDEDDDDYVEVEDESSSDMTDNDVESSQEDTVKNPQLDKLIDEDVGVKNKRDQLDSPNIKRHKSDINIKSDGDISIKGDDKDDKSDDGDISMDKSLEKSDVDESIDNSIDDSVDESVDKSIGDIEE